MRNGNHGFRIYGHDPKSYELDVNKLRHLSSAANVDLTINNTTSADIVFKTTNTERLIIEAGGNINYKGNKIYFGKSIETTASAFTGLYWAGQGDTKYSIHRSGDNWETNEDNAQLIINFNTGIIMDPGDYSDTDGRRKRKVDIQGRLEVETGTITSDNRLKHNEEDLSGCLQTICKLKPQKYLKSPYLHDGSFNYYGPNHHFDLSNIPVGVIWEAGFIAQDVRNTVPELDFIVDGNEYGLDESGNEIPTRLSMNYNSLHAYHVGAIQELLKKIETLEAKVALLEQERMFINER